MSITSLVGLTGNGKSYSAVELFILQAAKEGRPIVTNIPLLDKFFEDFPQVEFYEIDMQKAAADPSVFASIPGGSLVVFDELWRIWPAGLKLSAIPEWQISFIKESRHRISADGREMDVVLVTQNLADIASSIRTMSDFTIICIKLEELGAKNRFRRDYYRGAVTGFEGKKSAFIKSDHGCKYRSEVYQYYKSHTKGENLSGSVDNSGVVKASIFSGLGFRLGLAFLIFLIIFVAYSYKKTSAGIQRQIESSKPKVSAPVAQVAPGTPPPPAPPAPLPPPAKSPNSKYWRICGIPSVDGVVSTVLVCQPGSHALSLSYLHHCTRMEDGDVECIVDGERVTRFTGPHTLSVDGVAPAGLSNAADASSSLR